MIIANKLRNSNRAEFLLYMWQVEDILRAFNCDSDKISQEYLSQFKLSPKEKENTEAWYFNLCEMMRAENKKEKGHLQICTNILQDLEDLHSQLLKSDKFPYYREMYYKVLPYIVELRSKQKINEGTLDEHHSELSTCFDFLYGVMLLRLQKKDISQSTSQAVKDITNMLGQLSDYYFKDKQEPLVY